VAHYQNWRRHGNPILEGKSPSPKREAARYFRDVVLTHSGGECLIWPYLRTAHGYGILFNSKTRRNEIVSRKACEAANGPPPTPNHEAAHSCGKGHLGCVSPGHVSWKTHAENLHDMIAHGTVPHGEKGPGAKLTEDQVRAIRIRLSNGDRQPVIADAFGVARRTISDIATGKTWKLTA
jgi:hypothetical protein